MEDELRALGDTQVEHLRALLTDFIERHAAPRNSPLSAHERRTNQPDPTRLEPSAPFSPPRR